METKNKTLNFIKECVEFFQNDYYLLYDFLVTDTPWDRCLCYKIGMTSSELQEYKELFIASVISTYRKLIQSSMQTGQINLVDYPLLTNVMAGTPLNKLFFEDADSYLVMMKFYIYALRDEITFKKNTFNNHKVLISKINNLYYELLSQYDLLDLNIDPLSITSTTNYEKKYTIFRNELYTSLCTLFKHTFRNIDEEKEFINYIFSLSYAYLYQQQVKNNTLDSVELACMSVIEGEIDPREAFYYNMEIALIPIETLISLCDSAWPHIDIRKQIDDYDTQRYFANLDDNYHTEFACDIIITDYSVDASLANILSYLLKNKSYDEIYSLLTTDESIYDILMDHNLDGRHEQYFKYLIICKIIGDTYEYEGYLHATSTPNHPTYNILSKINSNQTFLLKYFKKNYQSLLKTYAIYHSDKTIVEKSRLHIIAIHEEKTISQINPYSTINYLLLKLDKVIPLSSVDYINRVVHHLNNHQEPTMLPNIEEENFIIRSICLNVYENLLLEPNHEPEHLDIISFIENTPNLVEDLKANHPLLKRILKIFSAYNQEPSTYKEEIDRRTSIKDSAKIKILNKINPFASKENPST